MFSFTKNEITLIKKLNTPAKVQDYLNGLQFNFEKGRETLKSPLFTLRAKRAHCFEGALLGAYILSQHGFKPYLMHLKTTRGDYDHVVAPFKVRSFWGALSKTNHAILRYREPIYKNIRELAMSYFHEYFLNDGRKTLRQYSALLDLNTLKKNWAVSKVDLWYIDKKLDKIKHYDMVPKFYIKNLRKADKIEIEAGKIVEYKK
ncbi:MAG: hypothetical protein UU58_C0008G0003 [Candidatus Nomurabacteria bacterium GW2011_GWA2_41_25]|uniref:Transglutaminase-like domain-containing protein n=2 Tax=Candidatus Nomuraibacteriota TaxID=1752729 RepID=A0A1F6YC24_9BACT|nr:MAG: hypothetical protein UU58_C0008G0003 [Candidatus Nomurabacteria bacterium GW2011_GWA2_41_25]OGI80355.1 MAG: hypothetical protein A3D43_02110 [Candidatus Nomurabacteria bacterium RIFCSPHIGHO2_02_FULL_41_52]OGI85324.1 MAG: hypothetical protein A3F49_01330 [Candidatus Nomurabacteria bacterium RIFCSPHIGHO2_12_FULL_42_19]OGI93521.1 MAG: hypothetical protein A3A07_01650 [Candidatus Nomurabacteria bacterium RIFCSPLOWO2_01_FULL_41_52]OGI99809.1 MAG: hypothetical protein A3H56_00620 [Candidatus 